MAQIKFVFLMHDVDQFNGSATDKVHESMGGGSGFEYPTDDGVQGMGGKTTRHTGRTKAELCNNMGAGSTLNDDKTELSLTCDFDSVSVAESWHTELDKRDPWATEGVVWEDRSKSVWTK